MKGGRTLWAFVCNYGWPDDPAAFERHYREVHVPLVKRFPDIRGVSLSFANRGEEHASDLYMISTMYWEDLESLRAALRSPERATAYADSESFRRYQLGRYVCKVDMV
jgi:uncharacterized protein (TIGR02118 family)